MQEFFVYLNNIIPDIGIKNIIEIIIMFIIIYKITISVKNIKAWIFLKGIIIVIGFYIISDVLELYAIKMIFEKLFGATIVFFIIVFQQEIKKLLGNIGKKRNFLKLKKDNKFYEILSDKSIQSIVAASEELSLEKVGALIVIERDFPLKAFCDTGIHIDSEISKQMISQIFFKNSPLHDGAMIIKDNKINAATCYLPLSTNPKINKSLGTRHRAGIGLSEISDSLVITISEENGNISTVLNGKISYDITIEELEKNLVEIQSTRNLKKEKRNIFKNIKSKFISIIIAFILWIVLINVEDPIISKTISNVEVSILNESKITDKNKTYKITDGNKTDVIISGKKSKIDKITISNISASADFSNLSIADAVEINAFANVEGVNAIPKTKMMKIKIEDIKEIDYAIEIEQTGILKSNNYIKDILLNKKSILISGPTSEINIIGNIKAIVDISNVKNNDKIKISPIIFDKNGNEMDKKLFNFNNEEIYAVINMYETKTVPLIINIKKENINGEIISYDYQKKDITIAASQSTLEKIENITLDIPISIDETIKTSVLEKVINLNEYLSPEINLAESNNKLNIKINYETYEEKTIEITEVQFLNTLKKYKYSLNQPVFIKVKGLKKNLENISSESLIVNIDVKGLKSGSYVLDLITNEIEDIQIDNTIKASVFIGD